MSKLIINGPTKLSGTINIKGAKNMALKIIPASILSEETITITNLPQIKDVEKSLDLLASLGAEIKKKNKGEVEISTKNVKNAELDHEIARKFRASVMFVGPLLARFGEVKFPHPGGCVLGAGGRPIDVFLEGFTALGAQIEEKTDYYHIKANNLKGGEFFFTKLISVTATETLMMTACLVKGKTILRNCAMEPEIVALANYLNSQGAIIKGAGTPTMEIEGVSKISAGTCNIIPDRLETGSFALMAAATKSELTITNCIPEHIQSLLEIFKKIGVDFEQGKDFIKIKERTGDLKSYSIKTHEYPGFPTDLQPPYTVLMTQAQGKTLIHDTIFDRRLLFTDSLSQMGANITMCDPHRVVINGPTKLFSHKLISPDIRAGLALLIAGLIAEGRTEISNIEQIERGYENIENRLKKLGANITKK